MSATGVRIESWLSESDERSLANDVLDGLTRPFKELPPKHFYDVFFDRRSGVDRDASAALRPCTG